MSNVPELRDRLALERTRLANERTFLAYVRTALSLIAGGVVLLQYFPDSSTYMLVGWSLAGCGVAVLLIGLVRFFRVRGSLRLRPNEL